MPRNGSGVFSLPAGNPVVSGTTISSTTHNNTNSDIATAITGSIAADGQTTITGPLKGALGAVGAPGYSFTGDLDTGMWSPGANALAWSIGGAEVARLNSTGLGIGVTPSVMVHAKGAGATARFRAESNSGVIGEMCADTNSALSIGSVSNHRVDIAANSAVVFTFTADGRIFGTSLHNNSNGVAGTTNQFIASGTYTPTYTNVQNVAAFASTGARACQWIRVGNVVHVSGAVNIDPTTGGILTSWRCTLPIASGFTVVEHLAGSGQGSDSAAHDVVSIFADAANDAAFFEMYVTGTADRVVYFHFTYLIL